jgi:L-2-amino-thiazoline-4-carboxylic acid hydrolase-like protein
MSPAVVKIVFGSPVRNAARRAMVGRRRFPSRPEAGRFTHRDIDDIVRRSWRGFEPLAASLPLPASPLGNRMLLLLSCLTLSCFQVLMELGQESERAEELVSDTAWEIYRKWGKIPYTFARLLHRTPSDRMQACVRGFLRFPFSPPGYRFEIYPTEDGVFLDMHHCQVADFFKAHGASELCVNTWCELDFGLAELWGGWLERDKTIASGCQLCNFRFKTGDNEKNGTESPFGCATARPQAPAALVSES